MSTNTEIKKLDDYRSKLSPELQKIFDQAYDEQIKYYKNRNMTPPPGGGGLPPIPQPKPLTQDPFSKDSDSNSQNQNQNQQPLTDIKADLDDYDVTKNPNYKKGYSDGIDDFNNGNPDPSENTSGNQSGQQGQGNQQGQGGQSSQQGQGNQQGQGGQSSQQGNTTKDDLLGPTDGTNGDNQGQGNQQGQSSSQGQSGQSGSQGQGSQGQASGADSQGQQSQGSQSGSQGSQQGQQGQGSQSGSQGQQGQGNQQNGQGQGQGKPKTKADLDREAYERGRRDGYKDAEKYYGKTGDSLDSNADPSKGSGNDSNGNKAGQGNGSNQDSQGSKGPGDQNGGSQPQSKLEKGKWDETSQENKSRHTNVTQGVNTTQSRNQKHILKDLGVLPEIISPDKMKEIREKEGYAKNSKKNAIETINEMEQTIEQAWKSGRTTPGGFCESMARKIKERKDFEASIQPDMWRDEFADCVASCLETFSEPTFSRRRISRPEVYRETTYYKTNNRDWQEPNKVQVIFLIDTSGSMGERRIYQCISECMGILAEDVGVGKCQLAYYMSGLQGKWDRVRSIDLEDDDYDWADDPDSPMYPTSKDIEGGGTNLAQTLADCTLINWTHYEGDDTWEIEDDEPCLDEKTIFVIMTDGDDYIAEDIVPEEFLDNKFIVLIISDKSQIESYKKDAEDPKVLGGLDCDIIGVDVNKLKY